MPYKRRAYRKKTPRRPRRKRRSPRYAISRSMGVPSGMPKQRTTVLRYAEAITIASTSGVAGRYYFKANDPYDPNFTGTGHQPISWDNWTNLFQRYVVLGSKMTAYITDNTSSHADPGLCGAYLCQSSAGGATDSSYMIESKKGQWKAITGGARSTTIVNSKFSAKKWFNVKDVKDNIDKLGGATSGSPTETSFFLIWYAAQGGATNTVNVQVVIDYIIQFSDPLDPTAS